MPIRDCEIFVMMSAIRTRFRSRSPLSDLMKSTMMFEVLILQNLNKLIEGEVGYFSSPKTFHAVEVQRFSGNRIKPSAEICGKFPMPISALVGNFMVETCEFSDSTPPVARTFYLTTQSLVEFSKFLQGLFQGLWVLYLLTRVQGQVGIHTEIYPNALTCRW